MSDSKYYVRFKGRVLGPFDDQKVRGLIKRGQVTRTHELSPDGLSWQPATAFEELFRSEVAAAATTMADPVETPADIPVEWYAHINEENKGPVTKQQLSEWVASGAVTAESLVWKEGLENWEAANILLPELFAGAGMAAAYQQPMQTGAVASLGEVKNCPFCAQSISGEAIKCPHCQSMLNNYCPNCGNQCSASQAVCLKCGSSLGARGVGSSEAVIIDGNDEYNGGSVVGNYSKQTAGILGLLLGGLGAHKFYHGSFGLGILYIVFIFTFVPAILGFVEGIMYLTMDQAEYDRKYNLTPPNPFKW